MIPDTTKAGGGVPGLKRSYFSPDGLPQSAYQEENVSPENKINQALRV